VRILAEELNKDKVKDKTPSELGYTNLFEVSDQSNEMVQANIEKVAAQAILSILDGNGLQYTLAQKGGGTNTQFVKELDRNFLEYKTMKRQFADSSQVRIETICRVAPPEYRVPTPRR
jgi:hypothetical protein